MKKTNLTTTILFILTLFLYWCNHDATNDIKQESQDKTSYTSPDQSDKKIEWDTINTLLDQNIKENIYTNKKEWFDILIPQWRTVQENKNTWRTLLSSPIEKWDILNENIIITTDNQTNHKTAQEYYLDQKKWIENHIKNYNEILKEDNDIQWYDSIKIIYQWSLWNHNLQRQQIIFFKDSKFFLITYTATQDTFDKYINQADQIINSFKF